MAHTYVLIRGIKHEMDQFITELQGKYLPYKWRDVNIPDSKLQDTNVQFSVRPIQLYEMVYPAECKDIVLTTIFGKPAQEGERTAGMTQHKIHEKIIWLIRKMLRINAPPKTWDTKMTMPIRKLGMEIIHVGDKPDKWINKKGEQVDEKEEGSFEAL